MRLLLITSALLLTLLACERREPHESWPREPEPLETPTALFHDELTPVIAIINLYPEGVKRMVTTKYDSAGIFMYTCEEHFDTRGYFTFRNTVSGADQSDTVTTYHIQIYMGNLLVQKDIYFDTTSLPITTTTFDYGDEGELLSSTRLGEDSYSKATYSYSFGDTTVCSTFVSDTLKTIEYEYGGQLIYRSSSPFTSATFYGDTTIHTEDALGDTTYFVMLNTSGEEVYGDEDRSDGRTYEYVSRDSQGNWLVRTASTGELTVREIEYH